MGKRKMLFAILLLTIAVITAWAQNNKKRKGISGYSERGMRIKKTSLPVVSSDMTYSFFATSDVPLKFHPVRVSESSLNPMPGVKIGKTRRETKSLSAAHESGNIFNPVLAGSQAIFYSALFGPTSPDWLWVFDFPLTPFVDSLNTLPNRGFRIESIDIYPGTDQSASLYAATWTKDDLGWAWALEFEDTSFVELMNSNAEQGLRIVDIEFDRLSRKFGGVWVADTLGWAWAISFGLQDFVQLIQDHKNAGRRPIDVQIYLNADQSAFLYAGVWVENPEGFEVVVALNQSWADFQQLLDEQAAANSRLIDYEVIRTPEDVRYSGVWVADGQASGYLLNFADKNAFLEQINTFRDDNDLRPVLFEMFTDFPVSVRDREPLTVNDYELAQNYPNPFNPTTTIKFAIPEAALVSVKIYNLLGQEIRTLVNEKLKAGRHEVPFNAEGLASGIYFYRMTARGKGTFVQTKKMSLVK